MPKPHKVEAVEELVGEFNGSQAALLASFRGLKVAELTELRRALAPSKTEFKVVKNTLARIAAREAGLDDLVPLLEGSTAIAFVKGDPVAAAKGLDEVSRKYPALVIKGGLLDRKVLTPDRAVALASVKPREVLLAGLAGAIQAPVATVVTLVAAPVRSLAYAFAAYRDKLGGGDTPPVSEPEAA